MNLDGDLTKTELVDAAFEFVKPRISEYASVLGYDLDRVQVIGLLAEFAYLIQDGRLPTKETK